MWCRGFIFYGLVAQLGERCVRNAEVEGSIPFKSTTGELPGASTGTLTGSLILFAAKICFRSRRSHQTSHSYTKANCRALPRGRSQARSFYSWRKSAFAHGALIKPVTATQRRAAGRFHGDAHRLAHFIRGENLLSLTALSSNQSQLHKGELPGASTGDAYRLAHFIRSGSLLSLTALSSVKSWDAPQVSFFDRYFSVNKIPFRLTLLFLRRGLFGLLFRLIIL